MSRYLPYITLSKKEISKLEAILNNEIQIDGLVIDIRRFYGNDYAQTIGIIGRILQKNPNAMILIDPRTDAFQSDITIRENIKSLSRIYELAGYSSEDIKDDSNFTSDHIEQKLETIIRNLLSKVSWIQIYGTSNRLHYLIPPYFVSSNYDDEWYRLTLKALDKAVDLVNNINATSNNIKIIAPIAIDKNILKDRDSIIRIVNDYASKSKDVDGYIILPYNLDETTDTETKLINLALLAKLLKEKTNKIVIVHVAEFGNILASLGIDAITSGICSRKTPYQLRTFDKGLAEIARVEEHIYVHKIFKKLYPEKFYKLTNLIDDVYSCDCPICSMYENSYYDMIEESGYTDFAVHCIYWKNKEMKMYHNKPEALISDLQEGIDLLNRYNEEIQREYFVIKQSRYSYQIDKSYLEKWLKVLLTLSHSDSANI